MPHSEAALLLIKFITESLMGLQVVCVIGVHALLAMRSGGLSHECTNGQIDDGINK